MNILIKISLKGLTWVWILIFEKGVNIIYGFVISSFIIA